MTMPREGFRPIQLCLYDSSKGDSGQTVEKCDILIERHRFLAGFAFIPRSGFDLFSALGNKSSRTAYVAPEINGRSSKFIYESNGEDKRKAVLSVLSPIMCQRCWKIVLSRSGGRYLVPHKGKPRQKRGSRK